VGITCSRWRSVSVALSVGSPRLGVTQHRALWSPDFPHPGAVASERDRPADLSTIFIIQEKEITVNPLCYRYRGRGAFLYPAKDS